MQEFGPNTNRVLFVRDVHVPLLDRQRADTIAEHSKRIPRDELALTQNRALNAARMWGEEETVMAASEALRRATWGIVWDSTWVDAWTVQWIIARAGIGLATQHLIGLAEYGIEDYITLVSPWTVGFKDLPIPFMEGMAA